MRRLMEVIASGRLDLKPLITHRFTLDQIVEAYDLFSHQKDGVMKVAITPGGLGGCSLVQRLNADGSLVARSEVRADADGYSGSARRCW